MKIKPFPIFLRMKIKPFSIFLRVKIKLFPIFLWVKIKPLQIFLLVKSNHTQSSYGWRLNLFNKSFVVYNNGSLKSSNIQYAHTNSVSRIWSIWFQKYFEEFDFQSMIFEWIENISLKKGLIDAKDVFSCMLLFSLLFHV